MKTLQHFFNNSQSHPLHYQRQSKIQQLRKPVYSKKLKQKSHKRSFKSSQFYPISQLKTSTNFMYRASTHQQYRVKRSKSDFQLNNKKENEQNEQSKNIQLSNNLIIQKLQYDKQANKFQVKKNNFLKTLAQITSSNNNNLIINSINNVQSTKNINSHKNNEIMKLKKSFEQDNPQFKQEKDRNIPISNKNQTINHKKQLNHKQNFKIIQLMKKQQIQQNITNQLTILRRKRNSLDQQNKLNQNKKESLIRKNSLYLMNYLKQKQKLQQKGKQPHINFIKNTTHNIKIQQNIDLRKNLIHKLNQKMIFKNKVLEEKSQKANKIFNTIKIQPW